MYYGRRCKHLCIAIVLFLFMWRPPRGRPPLMFRPLLRLAQNWWQVFFIDIGVEGWICSTVYHVCILWLFNAHQRRNIVWTYHFFDLAMPLPCSLNTSPPLLVRNSLSSQSIVCWNQNSQNLRGGTGPLLKRLPPETVSSTCWKVLTSANKTAV